MAGSPGEARVAFLNALDAASSASTGIALVRVDLDRFERIGQTFGPAVADTIYAMLIARLESLVDSDDRLVRLREDAFILVVESDDLSAEGLERAGNDIVELVSAPIDIAGDHIAVGSNVGISSTADFPTGDVLGPIAGAEVAIQHANALGSRRVIVFEPPTRPDVDAPAQVFTDMLTSIEAGQFQPYLQPIMALPRTGVVAAEAFARWLHPTRGVLEPGTFIPEAEASGLIRSIDACIRQFACSAGADLPARTIRTINVNTSTADLDSPALTEGIQATLTAAGLAPDRLVLEFHERSLTVDWSRSRRRIAELRDLGVRIAIDNFGSGHMYLDRLASGLFDIVKIDRSLVTTDAGPWQPPAVLLAGIAQLARGLGLDVVAEGVETEQQLARAIDAGCTHAQGFWLGAPLPADDFRRLWGHPG